MKLLFLLGAAAGVLAALGCGGSDTTGGGASRFTGPFSVPCDDTMDDVYAPATGLDPLEPSQRGNTVPGQACSGAGSCIKCAFDQELTLEDVKAALHDDGLGGSPATSVIEAYRMAYRTSRLTTGKGPRDGISSALVLVPQTILDKGTLVVIAHDTLGFGAQCAASLEDQLGATNGDDHAIDLAFAGHGYVTVVPDGAGFGYEGEPPGWSLAEDEAHSLLDATRAMNAVFPADVAPKRVLLVGFGVGGHTVLAAQSFAKDYGLEGDLLGVAAFAPLWVAPRTWGASLSGAAGLNTQDDGAQIALDLLYFYGHGELYDGPGGGLAPFRDDKRSGVRDAVEKRCFDDLVATVPELGTAPSDIFDPTFVHQVSACALAGGGAMCHVGAATVWNPRFSADRPSSDPAGAPILVWQGELDTVIPPEKAMCGKDKLERDLKGASGALTYCGDTKATHGGVVERDLGWVISWLDHATGHGSAPAACAPFAPKDAMDAAVTCDDTPPNGD